MKPLFFAAITLLLFGCGTPIYVTTTTAPPGDEIPAEGITEANYQVFYDQLGAYGNWIDYPDYGYVWHPNVDADFRPYATNGHWVYNDEGWVWVSNYNWGWAPFHYGRWFLDDNYGWLWVPGHEWAPSWVTWGRSGDYYGWAPLAPNVDADHWTPPQRAWNFVPGKRVTRPDVDKYVVNNNTANIAQNVTIIKNTTVVNNNYGGSRGNGGGRTGNGNIQVGVDNGRGTSTANPGNNNNRGNNNQPANGNNYNRGNGNTPNNNGNNNGRNNNNPPANNGNTPNSNQPANNRPNPNTPSYSGNNPNNNQPNTSRPASNITAPDNNGSRPVANNNTQPQPPSKYNRGPVINQVENATNDRVPQMNIRDKNQPGQTSVNPNTKTVTMFRPKVTPQQQNPNGQKPAPVKVDSYKGKKPNQ
jgi:hypothetical protein